MLLRREAQRRHSAGLEDLGRLLRATVDHLTTSRPLIHATASSGTTVEPCKKHAKSMQKAMKKGTSENFQGTFPVESP